ncbi:Dps family protein [Ochrovirga pacifica]|uniref:Dps family protein n=1 Tax=Ochrovirga pacifica TaxID=1042376 RepID=UPI0002558E6D|nr:DNA starvation/stationary phase protection protein [Ochrovirga pacifica]
MKTIVEIENQFSKEITKKLNVLLSNFQIHYQNLRGLHWNIKGKNFFELHTKFEEYYNDSQEKIDAIAERILTLEGTPLHTFSDYLENSNIKVGKNITQDVAAVQLVITGYKTLLEIERELLTLTDKADDEGTNALISEFISEQEKTLWMLKSWLA